MKRFQVLFASITGTALEFYDFMLYAVFADRIGNVFFPHSTLSDFQAGWITFVVAYVSRPFGATLFGHIGDKYGRKRALILTVSCMGIPTFLIGVLPGYETIGMFAPIILIFCRLIQGLCTGGEYNGSAIFTLEHVGKSYPGFSGGLITGASVIGALGANGVGVVITMEGMPEWSWRIAFLIGALVSLIGLYIRLYASESPAFQKMKKAHKTARSPLWSALTKHKRSVFAAMSIGLLNGTLSYTLYKFLNLYLNTYFGLPDHETFKYTNIGIFVFIISSPLWGLILDKLGGQRMLKFSCILSLCMAFPLYFFIQQLTPGAFVFSQMLLGITVASIAGPEHAFIQRLFPVEDRYSGVAFSFSTGMGVGAVACPPLMKFLTESTGNYYAPALVIIGAALICYIALKTYKGPYYDL